MLLLLLASLGAGVAPCFQGGVLLAELGFAIFYYYFSIENKKKHDLIWGFAFPTNTD